MLPALPSPGTRGCLLLALPVLVASFGTVNEPVGLGQHNEHEMVTRLALQCPQGQKSDGICFEPLSLNQLAGTHLDIFGVPIPGGGSNGAVGSPDTLDPFPEGPEAHCDDADYIDIPDYPQSRGQATAALQACVSHIRGRFHQAWGAADRLLDEKGRVREIMISLSEDCTFAFPSLQINRLGRAKCNAIEGLGRALHGIQDFYAHSNWADRSDPARAISDVNPPGLDRTDGASFLTDLRATAPVPASQIPTNLTTGCFAGPLSDKTPGVDECTGRVTHHTLTKDHGIINLDGTFGAAGPDTPRAELVPGNFERAVRAAVQGTRDAWAALRAELRQQYGAAKGELMICSLVRDNPLKDCRNRTVSYVLDRSWQAWLHNAGERERLAAQTLNSKLANDGTDQVTVIHFQGDAEIVSAWGDPDSAGLGTLDVPDADTPSNPGGALSLAIDQIIAANPDTYTDRGAVLLLGAGGESRDYVGDTLLQVQRAAAEGIRVHYGCVNPPPLPDDPIYAESIWSECWPGDGVVAAVLKTGGAFAYVSSRAGRTPADFASLVMNRGLTTSDDLDGADSTILSPGLTIADFLSPEVASKYFSYSASAGEHLNFTVQDRVLDGQGTGGCFSMILMDKVEQVQIAMFESCTGSVPSYLVYDATAPVELVLLGQYGSGSISAKRQQPVEGEIVFTVELFTNMPDKNEMTTTTTTMMMTTTSSSSSSTSAVDSSTSTSTTAQESTTQESTTQDSTTTSTSEASNTAQSTESSSSSSDSSSDSTSTSSTSSESSTSSSSSATTSASSTRKTCNKRRRTARALPSPTTSR